MARCARPSVLTYVPLFSVYAAPASSAWKIPLATSYEAIQLEKRGVRNLCL
jgi:hypothetical protein